MPTSKPGKPCSGVNGSVDAASPLKVGPMFETEEKSSKLLHIERTNLVCEGDTLRTKANNERRDLTGIESARFAAIKREIAAKNQEIEDHNAKFPEDTLEKHIRRSAEQL